MNNPMLHIIQLFSIINSFSKNIKKTSQCLFSNRYGYSGTGGCNFHIFMKTVTGSKHNTAYSVISNVLCHLHDQFFSAIFNGQRVFDRWKVMVFKFYVNYRSHYLYDFSFFHEETSFLPIYLSFILLCLGTSDYLRNFLGNGGLTHTIVLNR